MNAFGNKREITMLEDEQRGNVRFRPTALTFVAVRPNFARLGKVIDIGENGLSFQYLDQPVENRGRRLEAMEPMEIDMFLKDNRYYLPKMQCRLIYDSRSKEENSLPAGMETRRCGLRFGRLGKEQRDRLKFYLETYAAMTCCDVNAGGH